MVGYLGGLSESSLGHLSLSGFGILLSSSFLLFSQLVGLNLFGLGLVDGFNQDSLVLELVTLAFHVEFVIAILIIFYQTKTYRCLSIFLAALYFLNSLLRTLCLLIQRIFLGILASLVPLLLPRPVCLPIYRLAHLCSLNSLTLSLSFKVGSCSSSGVDSNVSSDDETILNELSDAHS